MSYNLIPSLKAIVSRVMYIYIYISTSLVNGRRGSNLCLCRATCVNVIYRFRDRVSANILHAYAPIGEETSPPFNNPDLRSRGGEFATETRNLAGRTCVTRIFFSRFFLFFFTTLRTKGLESFFLRFIFYYPLLEAAALIFNVFSCRILSKDKNVARFISTFPIETGPRKIYSPDN